MMEKETGGHPEESTLGNDAWLPRSDFGHWPCGACVSFLPTTAEGFFRSKLFQGSSQNLHVQRCRGAGRGRELPGTVRLCVSSSVNTDTDVDVDTDVD